MSDVAAVLEDDAPERVVVLATALADVLGAGVRQWSVAETGAPAGAHLVDALLGADDVAAAVLTAQVETPLCWRLMQQAAFPVVVIPQLSTGVPVSIRRVLVPLDGRRETALSVAPLVRQLSAAGVDVMVLHVFDEVTAPAFWDQASHSHSHWTEEFLRRNLPSAAGLQLRRGLPVDQVLAEERRTELDLVLIGWSQDLSGGRAATVRQLITDGVTPVLLTPAESPSAPLPRSR